MSDTIIMENREIALSVLSPTQKELEHGLKLHSNFLVFDSYGFQPHALFKGDILRQLVNQGASQREIKDKREESSMLGYVKNEEMRKEFIHAWRESGVNCVFQNAGEEGNSPMVLLKRLARFTYVVDMMKDIFYRAAVPEDIIRAKENKKFCLYFSGNGVPLSGDQYTVEEELRYIRIFFQLGVRMMHLTYNRRNLIGDGCGESSDCGLSDFGRTVIKEMNRVGVIIDVAHSGCRTSLEAAMVSEKPVVASHSAVSALNDHCRCKTDKIIKAIADKGGYIGICCIPSFLGRSGDINALLDHIDYISQKYGTDYVAIGTDRGYTLGNAESKEKAPDIKVRNRWEALWPEGSLNSKNAEQQVRTLAWTNWPIFTVGLVKRGYKDKDIEKILGGNVMRVAREVFPS
jgi:membrane dipeptidase